MNAWQQLRSLLVAASVVAVCYSSCGAVPVKQTLKMNVNMDTALLPISPADLRAALRANSHDAVALVQLVRRSDFQDEPMVAYDTLKRLRDTQPRNAVVLSAFAFASRIVHGNYQRRPNSHQVILPVTSVSNDEYWASLKQASKIDPTLWLPYALQGSSLIGHLDDKGQDRGLPLLVKAVRLAPHSSFAHCLLGQAYTLRPTAFMSNRKAIEEFEVSVALKPAVIEAATSLLIEYDLITPDHAKALQAKRTLVAMIPDGDWRHCALIDDYTRSRIALYPD